MNASLIADVVTLSAQATKADNAYNAAQYAQAALSIAQAATSLHYVEHQTPSGQLAPAPVAPIPAITARIKGYRQLSAEEQSLINEGKELAELCGKFIERLRRHPQAKPEQALTRPEGDALVPIDQRWVSIGATHLQEGWMAVIRGIAQPTTF